MEPEARKTFEKFVKQSDKIFNSRLIQSGLQFSLNISFDSEGSSMTLSQLDEEQLKALILDFRLFISKKESLYLPKIYTLIEKSRPSRQILDMTRQIRANQKQALASGMIQIQHDGIKYDDEDMFRLILNSDYAHLDEDKAEIFQNLGSNGKLFAREQFLAFIFIGVIEILNLRNAIKLILENEADSRKSVPTHDAGRLN